LWFQCFARKNEEKTLQTISQAKSIFINFYGDDLTEVTSKHPVVSDLLKMENFLFMLKKKKEISDLQNFI
jgi:hypothetical protein